MKKFVLVGIAATLLGGGAWYWASPALAMKGLKDAAVEGDKNELRERVDFPAVRESIKSQLKANLVAVMAKEKDDNPFGALGMMMATAMIDPLIDGVISPDGIKAIVQNGKFQKPNEAPNEVPDDNPKDKVEWQIIRNGLEMFTARPKMADPEKAPSLVFKREGLGWELVDIEIPADGMTP